MCNFFQPLLTYLSNDLIWFSLIYMRGFHCLWVETCLKLQKCAPSKTEDSCSLSLFLSLSLSLHSPFNLWGELHLWSFFYSILSQYFSRFPRILQQPQSVFEGALFFVGFNEFPSLVGRCWSISIQGDLLVKKDDRKIA